MQTNKRILVPTRKGRVFVYTKNILYISANDKCINIYGVKGGKLEVYLPLKSIIEKLNEKIFVKCHKSFIVNLNHINGIDHEFKKINLCCNNEIPIAKRRKKEFRNALNEFYELI